MGTILDNVVKTTPPRAMTAAAVARLGGLTAQLRAFHQQEERR